MRPKLSKHWSRPITQSARIALLMTAVAALLAWLVGHTHIVFADGLRYIEQARRLDRGDWSSGIREAVDHPLYPLVVVATKRMLGAGDGPLDWQLAAQVASAVAGVLLIVPLYLVSRELFGRETAWLACVLAYLVPLNGHVLADGLSEGWFLLLWTSGVWTSLRYLREGRVGWLGGSVVLGSFAYLCRPEGVLLPAALVGTIGLSVLIPSARLPRRRMWSALLLLTIGAMSLVGPYVVLKGGVGTKPAVARLLGLAPSSAAGAVERERPLPPDQTLLTTHFLAVKATGEAIRDAVPIPLLVLGLVGLILSARRSANPRPWIFLGVVSGGWLLALVRLHATGGYCSPRHTLIVSLPLTAAAAAGLRGLVAALVVKARLLGAITARRQVPVILRLAPIVFAIGFGAWNARPILAPVNAGSGGYRQAGEWLAQHAEPGERVVDVTGWSQFYGGQTGYVFRNLIEAPSDPSARWVVVRDAHLHGPWPYCERLRVLVDGARQVARFPEERVTGQSRVSVYERPRPDDPAFRQAASNEEIRTP